MSSTRLHRIYRLLMLAYPKWYRRERGTEILTTLLDDAAAGQRTPKPADALDIVLGGVRSRLRPPRHLAAFTVAAVAALYVGTAGAGLGVLASGFPGPPSDTQAVAAATAAVPGNPRNLPGQPLLNCDLFCPFGYNPYLDGAPAEDGDHVVASRGTPERTDATAVSFPMTHDEAMLAVDAARDRLTNDGWLITPLHIQSDGTRWFDATKDDLKLSVLAQAYDPTSPGLGHPVTVTVTKRHSATVVTALITGLAAGLLIGWATAVWVLQRLRRQPPLRRAMTCLTGLPFLLIGPPMLLLTAMVTMVSAAESGSKAFKAPLVVLTPGAWWPITTLAIGSAVTAMLITALPGRSRPWRPPAPAALRRP